MAETKFFQPKAIGFVCKTKFENFFWSCVGAFPMDKASNT
jgi:hypothetical protein